MKTDITITMTVEEYELLSELINLTAIMGVFRSGDTLQRRDEDLLQKIYDRGHDIKNRMTFKPPTSA